jgi:hypothetical protein
MSGSKLASIDGWDQIRMDGKIEIDGSVYLWPVSDGVLTVTSPDGRERQIQTGKTYPHVTVRILADELHTESKAPD